MANFKNLVGAIRFAERAHRHQIDKGGEPYICHCLRVGISLLPDFDAAVVGVLHDVLEDTDFDPRGDATLRLSPEQAEALTLLCRHPFVSLPSRRPRTYNIYVKRLSGHPLARKVKIADLKDNLDPRRLALATARLTECGFGDEMRVRGARYLAVLAWLEGISNETVDAS